MNRIAIATATLAATLAISACSGGDDEADTTEASTATSAIETPAPTTAAVEKTAAPTPTTAVPVETTEAPAAAPLDAPGADPLMPNVMCMNLQDAQDLIQETGNWLSLSEDATGADRMQIRDSNWFVVAQTPETGSPFGEGEAVLSVLKYDDAAAAEFQAICGL